MDNVVQGRAGRGILGLDLGRIPCLSPFAAGDIIRMPHTPVNKSFSNSRVPAWFIALD